jgi:hypothetical protein
VVLPEIGAWCLECAGLVSSQQAALEELPHQSALVAQGYLPGTPQAAVGHLDGVVASLAAAQIHNLISPYAPLQRYLVYNGLQAGIERIGASPSETCPVCSADVGMLALGELVG